MNNSHIKIFYNQETRVAHILSEIARVKGIQGFLDFGLFVKIRLSHNVYIIYNRYFKY